MNNEQNLGWFAMSNDGQMSAAEMQKEFKLHKVCPIIYFEENGENVVPIFPTQMRAREFANRNTPPKYTIGTVQAIDDDFNIINNLGYKIKEYDWPIKRNIQIMILSLNRNVQVHKGMRRGELKKLF